VQGPLGPLLANHAALTEGTLCLTAASRKRIYGTSRLLTRLPYISNNVGPVKSFLSALPRSLLRVVFLVLS
jgi:hypothetical protein